MKKDRSVVIVSLCVFILIAFLIPFKRAQAQSGSVEISRVIELKEVHLPEGTATGIKVMRNEKLPAAIMIKAPKGFAVCAHYNLKTMEKHGISAVMFMGVKSIEEALNAKVVAITAQAKSLGIKEGMGVREALEKMM